MSMKAIIKLDDVPDWQIGQMARVYFTDSAVMYGKCVPDNVLRMRRVFKSD